jgi:hypothetical protein
VRRDDERQDDACRSGRKSKPNARTPYRLQKAMREAQIHAKGFARFGLLRL